MKLAVYEDSARYDLWVKVLLALAPFALLVLGLLTYQGVLPNETEAEARTASIVLFACTAFILLLYWVILPRGFQILEDRIKVVLGGAFSFSIHFSGIKTARKTRGLAFGISFATSMNGVELVRERRTNVLLSPGNQDLFLENLNKALSNWREERSHEL
jgi:hypothetical protein